MTDKEYKRLLEAVENFGRKSSGSPEKARAVLRSIGVLDEHGNITPPFRKSAATDEESHNAYEQAAPHTGISRL